MSQGNEAPGAKRAATEVCADRLGALPDGLLQHVMSFLPSTDAVRTCVLARRWRHQWMDVPALRITYEDARHRRRRAWDASGLNKFVNSLLMLRNRVPLHEAEINTFEDAEYFDETVEYLDLWIRYSLLLQVYKLSVTTHDDAERWLLPKRLITSASEYLTILELTRVESEHDLDFSSCVALQELKMEYSSISCDRVVSPSLKRLSIAMCTFQGNVRTQISAPNLLYLLLVDCNGRTPLLGSIPFLVQAFVRIQHCADRCENNYELGDCGDDECGGCRGSNYPKTTGVVLQALSNCTNLELTADPTSFIFRKDLARCPVFSKLKTLLLNEWCMTANLGALICFLQHSPVLEKLVLQFPPDHEDLVENGASYDLKVQPFVSKDLTVEVKCYEVDEHIRKFFDVLVSYGLPPEKIKIREPPELLAISPFMDSWCSGSFTLEQETQSGC